MARVRVKKSITNAAVPNQTAPGFDSSRMQKPSTSVARSLKPVPREEANIEAEKGETALFPDKNGLPAQFNIEGNRHVNGGTPLNVPENTFIFSDTKKMRIKDPEILAEFGKSKGSYTPADLAKKYDINKYRKLLQDPDSDDLQIKTAEKMIANYNLKLGKLALVQESKKGFPQGIPAVAMGYMATYNISPDSILPLKAEEQEARPAMARYGASMQIGGYMLPPPININPSQDPESLWDYPDASQFKPATIAYDPANADYMSSFAPGTSSDLTREEAIAAIGDDPADQVPFGFEKYKHVKGKVKSKPGRYKMNPEDKVNWGIADAKVLTNALTAKQEDPNDYLASNFFAPEEYRDRGDYTRNEGYFRPDQQNVGNIVTGKYGLQKAQGGLEAEKLIQNYLLKKEAQEQAYQEGLHRLEAQRREEERRKEAMKQQNARAVIEGRKQGIEKEYYDAAKALENSNVFNEDALMNRLIKAKTAYDMLHSSVPSSTQFGPGFIYTQPNAGPVYTQPDATPITYDIGMIPYEPIGAPTTSRVRISKPQSFQAAAPAKTSTPAASVQSNSTAVAEPAGMSIEDYMKEYSVDRETATQLKNAE